MSAPVRPRYLPHDDWLGETRRVTSWDDKAERYIEMVRDPSQGFNHLAGDVADELLGRVEGRTVLDIGCGEGSFARHLARRGAKVVAVEPTERLLAAAIDAQRKTPLGIDYRNDRAETLDAVESASVDLAVALLVLHHVADLGSALRSAHRVLRPDGGLVLVVPHPATDHAGATSSTTAQGLKPRRRVVEGGCRMLCSSPRAAR